MTAFVKIQKEEIDPAGELDALAKRCEDAGAIASFTGRVRSDRDLTALVLEHYPAMTEREIARHVAEAERNWPLLGIHVIHRIGRLTPGEPIVFVAVAAAHRRAAFEACEFLMDYLKVRAPIWKQEERGNDIHWVEAKQTDREAAKRWGI
jgi:molybdopterin synthase catalytic subunit